jgi:hypothetical protein
MLFPRKVVLVLAFAALLWVGSSASAQTYQQLFFDDFEDYKAGTLDKNDTITPGGGPNQAPNGSGNPWFGPEASSPNLLVVGPENGVWPISGLHMVKGRAPSDFDQDWYNVAYRLNPDPNNPGSGLPFTQNIILDWWFYDPINQNDPNSDPTTYRDFVALAYYDTAPLNTDAPDSYDINAGVQNIQRLSLGASSRVHDAGYDPTMYQARVVGLDGNIMFGWFNTVTPRSKGWHHGMIMLGPLNPDAPMR